MEEQEAPSMAAVAASQACVGTAAQTWWSGALPAERCLTELVQLGLGVQSQTVAGYLQSRLLQCTTGCRTCCGEAAAVLW